MSALARPGVLAGVLVAAALALHPATAALVPSRPAVLAATLVLAALGLAVRAATRRDRRAAAALTAAGALGVVGALGVDGLRGHRGTLALASGQSRGNFEETGPGGRSLGLRPLGFAVGAAGARADGSVELLLPGQGGPVLLTPGRAVAFGGYRFGRPRALPPTGGAARLRVAVTDGARTSTVDVAPGAPARAGDLGVALEQYFPDFALDDRQQPFSRSAEPRNPAAVLAIERGGQSFRAFVMQSMPGVHRVEELGLTFSLLEVDPERPVEIAVHREPAALGALAFALVLASGLGLGMLARAERPPSVVAAGGSTAILVGGTALASFLGLVDGGSVLGWRFSLPAPAGPVALPDVGGLLGAALVLALGGSLLLLADRLAGVATGAVSWARGALWGAVALGTSGLAVAVGRAVLLPAGTAADKGPLVGLAAGVGVLAVSLAATGPSPSARVARLAAGALAPVAWLGVAAAIAAAVASTLRQGTYAAEPVAATAAAALLGLAALEPTGAAGIRRFAFLVALLALATA